MSKDATKDEYTGGDVSYYVLEITHPKRFAPCTVECEDVIQALGMTFDEGCEFKAQWRSAAQRTLGLRKKGADEHGVYDAEKQVHYATRTLNYRRRLAGAAAPVTEPTFAALSATLKSFAQGETVKFDMSIAPPNPETVGRWAVDKILDNQEQARAARDMAIAKAVRDVVLAHLSPTAQNYGQVLMMNLQAIIAGVKEPT